jgi:hypothetical protein
VSGQKRGEGSVFWMHELVEAGCGLGGVFALGWWVPGVWRPSHLIFCAFFLLVFAVAVRSQTCVAYGSAFCTALAYGLLLWLHPAARPAMLSLALEPCVLLLTGICASDILRWQRHRLAALEQTSARTREALQETQEKCQQVMQARETLERQVREMPLSVITVCENLAHWWLLTGVQQFSALVDVLIWALEVQSCACYVQEGKTLYLCAECTIGPAAHAPVLDTENPLIKRVIDGRRVSTVYDAGVEKGGLVDGAIMAGPLLSPSGELRGVVIIDSMPLLRLTSAATRLFGSLLQIFSFSLHAKRGSAPEKVGV